MFRFSVNSTHFTFLISELLHLWYRNSSIVYHQIFDNVTSLPNKELATSRVIKLVTFRTFFNLEYQYAMFLIKSNYVESINFKTFTYAAYFSLLTFRLNSLHHRFFEYIRNHSEEYHSAPHDSTLEKSFSLTARNPKASSIECDQLIMKNILL